MHLWLKWSATTLRHSAFPVLFIREIFWKKLRLTVTHSNMLTDEGKDSLSPRSTLKVRDRNFFSVHWFLINTFQNKWRIDWQKSVRRSILICGSKLLSYSFYETEKSTEKYYETLIKKVGCVWKSCNYEFYYICYWWDIYTETTAGKSLIRKWKALPYSVVWKPQYNNRVVSCLSESHNITTVSLVVCLKATI